MERVWGEEQETSVQISALLSLLGTLGESLLSPSFSFLFCNSSN